MMAGPTKRPAPQRKKNPTRRRTVPAKKPVTRKSQITGRKPTPRLLVRRKKKPVKGYFPNPPSIHHADSRGYWVVESIPKGHFRFEYSMWSMTLPLVKNIAQAFATKYGVQARVSEIWT